MTKWTYSVKPESTDKYETSHCHSQLATEWSFTSYYWGYLFLLWVNSDWSTGQRTAISKYLNISPDIGVRSMRKEGGMDAAKEGAKEGGKEGGTEGGMEGGRSTDSGENDIILFIQYIFLTQSNFCI